jgi:DNA-binding HxlR family transcriptional regulator
MSRAAVTVEYRLTALGHSLAAAVSVIKAWAYEHIEELEVARDRYDQAAVTRTPAGQAIRPAAR